MSETKPSYLNWLLLTATLLLSCGFATAATVRAYVQPENAQAGQVVNFVITVQNGSVKGLPQLRLPAQIGMNTGVSTSQTHEFRNNQQTTSTQMAWGIVSTEPGVFVIPPQEVRVNDEVLKTNEVRLTVTEAASMPKAAESDEEANTPLFQIELGRAEFYHGEMVPVSASIYIPRRVNLRRVGLIDIDKNDFAIARFPQQPEQSETVINGVGYLVLTYRSMLSALHPGTLKVGPASCELLFEVFEEDPRQMRRGMGMPFGFGMVMGNTETRKQVVKSNEVKVKVLPLPTEGKPPGFTGAVGDFDMSATATPAELAVGDPLAVEVTVVGSGNFESLPEPRLTPPDGWKAYPTRRYNVDGPVDPNATPTANRRIAYSMVFVPEKIHTMLPPFEFDYFSPTQKKYVKASTAPIPLQIKPGTAVAGTTDTGTAAGSEPPKPPAVQQPKPNLSDIVTVLPSQANWVSTVAAAAPAAHSSTRFWASQMLPALLVLVAGFIKWLRSRQKDEDAAKRQELRRLWQGLEDKSLDDRTFLQRAAQFIQRTHPGEIKDEALRHILQRYEATSFTASHSVTPLSTEERGQMLQRLAPLLKTALLCLALLLTSNLQAAEQASPDTVYQQAREELDKGKFTQAQYLAESLTKRTPPVLSAETFSIIGHARYRQDDLGRAALWYQRAQLLNPSNAEIRQNLRHLDEKLRFFRFTSYSPLVEWSLLLPKQAWLNLTSLGFWLAAAAISLKLLTGRKMPTLLVVLLVAVSLLITVPSACLAAFRPDSGTLTKDVMVITMPNVSAYSSATVTAGSLIDLPPGSQVRLLEKRGAWSYVEIPASGEPLRGWVEATTYTPLWPWESSLVP